MRAILEGAGLSVHVYTSPHLVRFNERFRLGAPGGGRLVSDDALAAALSECERANAGEPITVFEIETAAAFLLFSRNPADVLLLEVGLGGRLDATNVIERADRLCDHVDIDGSPGVSRRHAGENRRRKSGNPETRRPGCGRAAGRRRADRHRKAGEAGARAAAGGRRTLERSRGARAPGLPGRRWPARLATAEAERSSSARQMRGSRWPRCERPDWRCRCRPSRSGSPRPNGRRVCSS